MRAYVAFAILMAVSACTSATRIAQGSPQAHRVPERTDTGTATAIPPGVTIEDGLTPDEAVAIALWNNPDFRVQLTDLGFARADLLEAGMLRNPVLSLLFPVGPKQLEATLRFPVEVLWERPRRVAAASVALNRVAASLEQHGLNLVAEVKVAVIELGLAADRARLVHSAAAQAEQIRDIARARLRAGDISDLEARSADIDAARARHDADRATFEVELRSNTLRSRLGLALHPGALTLAAAPDASGACADRPGLLDHALASRPDVRAAEIAVEGAAARMGWEKSRVLTVTAVLDVNGPKATQGHEVGPGVDLGLPLFDRNQAGRARAAMELQRTALSYVAARQRVATEVTDGLTQLSQARSTLGSWQQSVVLPLEEQVSAAERAFAAGDTSYLFVLEMTRRLTDARVRAREVQADVARAAARLERAIGRSCETKGQGSAAGF
jgi:cobalt-zinc-cadmium efflux system outer membrane protein